MKTFIGIMLLAITISAWGQDSIVNPDLSHEGLKAALGTPLVLFAVMILASFGDGLKKIGVAQAQNSNMSLRQYFFSHWVQTSASFIANVVAFLILVATDQLNLASAIGIGYATNNVLDSINPTAGRTAQIASSTSIGNKI